MFQSLIAACIRYAQEIGGAFDIGHSELNGIWFAIIVVKSNEEKKERRKKRKTQNAKRAREHFCFGGFIL